VATGFSRKLGIILDGFLVSAPAIRSTISGRGEITGSFSRQEVDDLVDVLNAGSLPAPLVKVGELSPHVGQ
jgi:preprotein translocase subunit SecD